VTISPAATFSSWPRLRNRPKLWWFSIWYFSRKTSLLFLLGLQGTFHAEINKRMVYKIWLEVRHLQANAEYPHFRDVHRIAWHFWQWKIWGCVYKESCESVITTICRVVQ
jgi:hypothetical protein